MVDLPEPVGPVMAKMPEDWRGSWVKSISVIPSREARFFILMASISMRNVLNDFGKQLVDLRRRGLSKPGSIYLGEYLCWLKILHLIQG
jgi:hypothetical protein